MRLAQHIRFVAVALLFAAVLAPRASAQVGSTTDILTGTVTGTDGKPIMGAQVEATSVETQIVRTRKTDIHGRYTILFPDGGGQYTVVIRFIGMAPTQLTLSRQADEDRLVGDAQLSPVAIALNPIVVTGRQRPRTQVGEGPGSTERNLNPELMNRLPIDASDLNALATLVPGVVGISGTDTTDASFSVAGQRATANNITLDGLSFGSGSVPSDAVRTTRVVTSTYDVARGQFSGGLVSSTTRSGTNVPTGSFTYTLRDKDLAWGGITSSPFAQGYTQNQIGGGFGGALQQNKLFLFASLQGRWRDQGLADLLTADAASLERLGVNPDSAAQFIAITSLTGVPLNLPGIPLDKTNDNATGLVRMDWNFADAQTLMLRFDGRWTGQDPTRLSALALPPTGGSSSDHGGGVMASLTSYFGGNFINEARVYVSGDRRTQSGFLALPEGRVLVGSQLGDSSRGISTLDFGGNPSVPQRTNQAGVEFTNEVSWLPGATAHRIKFGTYLNIARQTSDQTPNQLGTFFYNSLAALDSNQASMFTRTLSPLDQGGTRWNGALYLGDTWRVNPAWQLTYGARLEAARFEGAPQFNPAVDSLFGQRTDAIPHELHFSPRVGFTWTVGSAPGVFATTIVRGGFGDFRSLTPASLYTAALAAPGFSNAEAQLVCVGSAVPIPDWNQYESNPGSIPSQCTDTTSIVTINPTPNVTVFAPSYAAPHAWRGSLGIQRRIAGTYTLSLDANWARGMSQYGFRDLNLNTTPQFTLAGEGNRPVYVPSDSIVPFTGALTSLDSRRYTQFGDVIAIGSDLESDSKQVTLGLTGFTGRGMTFSLSYTYSRAQDQSSFNCCAATQGFASSTTAGNPNVREWATSDFERRHSILGTVTYPVTAALEVTAIGRLTSGTPFTPMVGSDINGDGARNDRAFIFDPATSTDTAVAAAMGRLLNTVPSRVKNCLTSQMGRVAGRNTCTGPWQPSLDFQLNWRPGYFGLDRRLTISIVTSNLLGGLDALLHGTDHLHGWGFAASPDPTLLYVRGFDPSTKSFVYSVNGRFGTTQSSGGGFIVPFQLGFQAHFTIGPDRTRDRLNSAFGGRGGGGGGGGNRGGGGFGGGPGAGGGGAGAPDFAARFARALPNPISEILAYRDSLNFTNDQANALQAIADSLDLLNKAVADSMQATIAGAGTRPDPGILFAKLRPKLAQARTNQQNALAKAKTILTPEQWAKLPDAVKTPGGGRRPGARPPN